MHEPGSLGRPSRHHERRCARRETDMLIPRTAARFTRKLRWVLLALAIVCGCGWLLWLTGAPERRRAYMLFREGNLMVFGANVATSAWLGYGPFFTFADVFWCVHDTGWEPSMGPPEVSSSLMDPNPFPACLGGKRYGRLDGWPRDMPPDMVPLIWDLDPCEGKIAVAFLLGSFRLLTRDELDAALDAVRTWEENPERERLAKPEVRPCSPAEQAQEGQTGSSAPSRREWPRETPTDVFAAVIAGDIAVLKAILERDTEAARRRSQEGDPPLLWAVRSPMAAKAVELLLQAGADPNAAGRNGWTPLHEASAGWCDVKLVEVLIANGADVNRMDDWSRTPLVVAASLGGGVKVRALLARGANPNAYGGLAYSALHWVVLHGDEGAVELLLEAGADVNAGGVRGYTPLDIAVGRDDEAMARLLLNAGADPGRAGANSSTPLHTAARLGNVRMAEQMVSAGAKVNVRGPDGRTPLHEAARSGHESMAAWLLERGADIEARDGRGWTALHFAAFEGRRQAVAQLLACGADPGARDRDGRTARDLALKEQHAEVALLLPATALPWGSRVRPYLAAAAVVLVVLLALALRKRGGVAKSRRKQEG